MHTIAVFSSKGGAGKSAVAVLLAEALACKPFRKRVLVVDLDAQQSAATALLGDEGLHGALADHRSATDLMRASRAGPLSAGDARRHLAVRPGVGGGGKFNYLQPIHILASDKEQWHDLDDDLRDEERASRNGPPSNRLLRDALSPLRDEFDVALIDFPGHDGGPVVRCGSTRLTAGWSRSPPTGWG
ncbi:MAG: ParA family protein [Gemmataceae bacterium]